MVPWTTSIVGVLIVVWTLREVFLDLFQPSGSGSLSAFLGRAIFQLSKHVPSTMRVSGPLCIVVVIACWAFLVAAGFALIYWSSFPYAFHLAEQQAPGIQNKLWAVLYFSLGSLTTLSSAEIVPRGNVLRMLAACESLIGQSLVTASITWIVLIYPALGRMRALSRRTSNLVRAEQQTGLSALSGGAESILVDFAASITRTRVDFIHFPLIYYFHADTEGASLARSLCNLTKLAELGRNRENSEPTRLAGAMLSNAISDIAALLSAKFVSNVDGQSPSAVFQAVGRDHLEEDLELSVKRDSKVN